MKKEQYGEHFNKEVKKANEKINTLFDQRKQANDPDSWETVREAYQTFVKDVDELHKVYTSENGGNGKKA